MRLLILLMMTALSCFLLKLSSHHPYRFTSRFQQTLTQNHRASRNWYSLNNMLKRLAFKWLLNKLLLEIEWSEVKLIWWFISIIFTKSFRKFFFNIFIQNYSSCNFNYISTKTVTFPSTDFIMVTIFGFSSIFFSDRYHLLFFFCLFWK